MANENVTTKFKVDISDLKKNIAEANRQIQLANAEFKNATVGMDDWARSADGLSAKIKAQQAILDAEKTKLAALKEELERVEAVQKEAEQSADKLSKEYKEAVEQFGEGSEQAKKLAKELAEAEKAVEKNTTAAEKLRIQIVNQDTAVKDVEGSLNRYESELNELTSDSQSAANATDDLNDSLDDVDDHAKKASSGGIDAFGVALGNLASNIIQNAINKLKDFVKESINVGASFEAGMSKVAAVSGASAKDLELLEAKAKEMGATTKFSATEASDALNYMAMAGWKTNDMLGGIEGIMNLAAASGEELGTTSDIVTDALTAFGMSADQSGRFADVLAAASSNANTNVSLMGESFKYAGSVAGAMGASIEDTSIALGLMANSGIKGSMAGNSLKNALVNLTKPTKQQADAMQKLGFITTETIQKIDFKKVEKAEQNVEDATINLESAQIKLNDAIAKYGEGSSQAELASNNYEKAQLKLQRAEEELKTEQEGVSKEIAGANTLMTDSEGNMKSLGEIMNTLREKMGKVNVELTDADGNARDFDDIVNELSTSTEGLAQAEQLQSAAAIFGKQNMAGMLAIINASEKDYNKLTNAIYGSEGAAKAMADTMSDNLAGDTAKMKSNLESLQLMIYDKLAPTLRDGVATLNNIIDKLKDFLPWLEKNGSTVLIALTGAVAALTGQLIANKAATIAATVAEMSAAAAAKGMTLAQYALNTAINANPVGALILALTALVAAFKYLWDNCEGFRNFWIGLWEKIQPVATVAIEEITEFFKTAWETIKVVWSAATQWFKDLFDAIKNSAAFDFIVKYFKTAWEVIKAEFSIVIGYFKTLWDNIKLVFSAVKAVLSGDFEGAWKAIKKIVDNWAKYFKKNVWENIKKIFSVVDKFFGNVFSEAWKNVKKAWEGAGKWFNDKVVTPIKNFFTTGFKAITTTTNACLDGIKKVWSVVASWFEKTVIDPLTGNFKAGFKIIGELSEGCWKLIKALWEKASGWFNTNVIAPVKELFEKAWNNIYGFVKGAWDNIVKYWTGAKQWFDNTVVNPIKGIFDTAWSAISGFADSAWTTIKNTWTAVSGWFNDHVVSPVKGFFEGMWEKVKTGASDAWTGITNAFGSIAEWFEDKFSKAWTKVKEVFSTGGEVFGGIVEGIENAFKKVVNFIIRGINKVVAIPFNAINDTLDKLRNAEIAGIKPFENVITRFSVPQIPELEKGGILRKGQVGLLEGNGAEAVVPLEKNTLGLKKIAGLIASEIGLGGNSISTTNNYYFNQINNSPTALSRWDIYRQTKNLINASKGAVTNV